jgi:hypothetical protein
LNEFVDITRNFVALRDEETPDEPDKSLYARFWPEDEGVAFETLLETPCSVILGMQGSGKTTELRRARDRLRRAGKACFLVRLETLATYGLKDSLDPEDVVAPTLFDSWLKDTGAGIFLLDALDEATLPSGRTTQALTGAMQAFANGVGQAGPRCKLVITSRGSEWDNNADRRFLLARTRNLAGGAAGALPPEETLRVYAIADLTQSQVADLASSRGIDGQDFVRVIIANRCQALARTPLEVGYLCDVWEEDLKSGRPVGDSFTTRAKLFERATEYKLRPPEDGPRRSDLPRDAVLEAVEALAAATIIAGVNDLSLTLRSERIIDPGHVLSASSRGWSEPELRQLLSFSFFAANIAGRVRFAHRELRDFLAARYFDRVITQTGGSLDCLDPLIARFGDFETIPGALYNFFGWLATFNAAARRRVAGLYPTLILETGDPRRISPDDRAMALRAHAANYRDRSLRGHYFYDSDLVAFATPDLASTLIELLEEAVSPELQRHLIDIARCGRFPDLAGQVCEIACRSNADQSARTEALAALLEIGDEETIDRALAAVRQTISETGEVSPASAGRWNEFLILAAMLATVRGRPVEGAREFLEPLARERRNGSSMAGRRARALVEGDSLVRRRAWLALLADLTLSGRSAARGHAPEFVTRRLCLLPVAAGQLAKMMEEPGAAPLDDRALELAEGICSLTYQQAPYRYAREISKFVESLSARRDVKAAILKNRWQLFDGDPRRKSWGVVHYLNVERIGRDVLLWRSDDVVEQLERASACVESLDVSTYFYVAWQVFTELAPGEDRKQALRALIKFARQSGNREFKRAVVPRWPRRFWRWWYQHNYRFRYDHIKRVWPRFAKDKVAKILQKMRNRATLVRDASSTRRGEAVNILAWAGRQHLRDHEDKGVTANLEVLASVYGRAFARRAEAGYRALWRKAEPVLPLAWGERLVEAAALGLERDLQEHVTLSEDEASRAAAIVFSLWGGAPDWAAGCFPEHSDAFRNVARPALRTELLHPDVRRGPSHGIAYSTAYGPLPLKAALTPVLIQALMEAEDVPHETLRLILALSLDHGVASSVPRELLRRRFANLAAEGRFANAFLWYEFWLRQDPMDAWSGLEPWLAFWGRSDDSPFINFLASYGSLGQLSPQDAEPPDEFHTCPDVLGRLVKLAYQVAGPETDIFHEDTYSPSTRDRAGDTRRRWRERLTGMNTLPAHEALVALSNDPDLARHREDFLYCADRLAAGAARHDPIPAGDIREWLVDHSPVPHDRLSYANYVFRLTAALLHDFAHSDHDEARPFRRLARTDISQRDEADARNWLSGRLSQAGRAVFEPVREAEVVEGNRTDIHLIARNPSLGKIVLEVKLADRPHWSGDVLVSTIETQVRDLYLRSDEAHAGALVLINTRADGFAKRVSGREVDFEGLCIAINDRIRSLDDDKTLRLLAITL